MAPKQKAQTEAQVRERSGMALTDRWFVTYNDDGGYDIVKTFSEACELQRSNLAEGCTGVLVGVARPCDFDVDGDPMGWEPDYDTAE